MNWPKRMAYTEKPWLTPRRLWMTSSPVPPGIPLAQPCSTTGLTLWTSGTVRCALYQLSLLGRTKKHTPRLSRPSAGHARYVVVFHIWKKLREIIRGTVNAGQEAFPDCFIKVMIETDRLRLFTAAPEPSMGGRNWISPETFQLSSLTTLSSLPWWWTTRARWFPSPNTVIMGRDPVP